ncbi:MAG: DUF1304 domain-containing protein [Parvularculaceae bacterium]
MSVIAKLLMAALAALHGYFLYLEMFTWTSARTIAAFGMTTEFAEASKVLAANQGLYNGFLAAGMVWSVFAPAVLTRSLGLFFAGCALVAGMYGGVTGPDRIFLVQALPAALTLAAIYASARPKLR